MPRFLRTLSVTLCIAILISGCQPAPKQNVVTSKKDGSFDIAAVHSATEPSEIISDSQKNITLKSNSPESSETLYTEEFCSSDSSVNFTYRIPSVCYDKPVPVLEVVPHYLTEDDVKSVAKAIFGEVDFYEFEPFLSPTYSKMKFKENLPDGRKTAAV